MQDQNIVLTGIPRSGTTLTCSLINQVENAIALVEPMQSRKFLEFYHPDDVMNEIDIFFDQQRKSLLQSGQAISKHRSDQVTDNTFKSQSSRSLVQLLRSVVGKQNFRDEAVSKSLIRFDKTLTEDFLLCIKHPGPFTAVIDSLITKYSTYAIVRNPLPVLLSWNTVRIPPSRGRQPICEHFDENLSRGLANLTHKIDKQIYLLSWFFGKYREFLPAGRVITYEDIIRTNGEVINTITQVKHINKNLKDKNQHIGDENKKVKEIGKILLNSEGDFWHFYNKSDVEKIIDSK